MNISVKKEANVCTLIIEDRIDTLTAPELDEAFQENAGDCDKMIFDLSGVDYISSSGLRVLISAHRRMEQTGGLVLKGVTSDVYSILKITGLEKRLRIED